MATILVTDGDERSSLAVVRSLGRAGHDVLVGASRLGSLAGASRFARESMILPPPLTKPLAFAEAAIDISRRTRCDFVIPMTDASILSLLPRRSEMKPTVIPCPSLNSFCDISDKELVAAKAASVGIRVPLQTVVEHPSQIDTVVSKLPGGTALVLKPARSVVEAESGVLTKQGVMYAGDTAEVRRKLRAFSAHAYPILIQERIIGPGVGVFLLRWNSEIVASFAHRRIREKPPSGGVSVLSESIELAQALEKRSADLLALFDWNGIAMIEYKLDASAQEPVLMEVNGRFWGSLQLAIDAGVDFPRVLIEAVSGQSLKKPAWRIGIRSRWFWGYLDSLLTRIRHSSRQLHVQPGMTRMGALVELATLARPVPDQVYRCNDRGPAWRELLDRFQGRAH